MTVYVRLVLPAATKVSMVRQRASIALRAGLASKKQKQKLVVAVFVLPAGIAWRVARQPCRKNALLGISARKVVEFRWQCHPENMCDTAASTSICLPFANKGTSALVTAI